jgi:hypothetical protein
MEVEASTMCKDRFAAYLTLLNHEAVTRRWVSPRTGYLTEGRATDTFCPPHEGQA